MPLHKEQPAPSARVEDWHKFALGAAATLTMPVQQQTALTSGWADCMMCLQCSHLHMRPDMQQAPQWSASGLPLSHQSRSAPHQCTSD